MKASITVLDGQFINPGDISWSGVEQLGSSFTLYDTTENHEVIERAKDATVILTNKVVLSREILLQLPKLKLICVMSTGYNVIDIDTCNEKGIYLANVPAYSTPFVAQHTFALIFEAMNAVGLTANAVRNGEWQQRGLWTYSDQTLRELAGKTLGIIGMGNIGQKVASIGAAFDMNVIYHSRNKKEHLSFSYCSQEEVFKNSDILSLHVQLTDENRHMINSDSLGMMKSSSILINTGRGDLIHEDDLASCLLRKGISAAGLDVLSSEPPQLDNPLIPLKNCVITPHQAWLSIEARTRLMDALKKNIESFIRNTPINIVNTPTI